MLKSAIKTDFLTLEPQNTAVASNINSNDNLSISSGMNSLSSGTIDSGNTNITGSKLNSGNSNIEITSKNNTNIQASNHQSQSSSKTESYNQSTTLVSSNGAGTGALIDNIVNTASLALGAGISKSNANSSSINYNNTELLAANGKIKINSLNNADIKGANLLAQNIQLNTVNNLNIESLQDQANSKSKSWGVSLGGSTGLSGSASPCLGGSGCASATSAEQGGSSLSGNFGINYNNSKTDKLWVENQTSIIGTNSVQINTGKNTNLVGAVIANQDANGNDLGNLALNTNTLTYANLYDHDYQQSSGFGFSSGAASNNTTGQGTAPANNPNQQNNFYPNGPTTISVSNSGYIVTPSCQTSFSFS